MRSATSWPRAGVDLQRLADAQAGLAREAALEQHLVGAAGRRPSVTRGTSTGASGRGQAVEPDVDA